MSGSGGGGTPSSWHWLVVSVAGVVVFVVASLGGTAAAVNDRPWLALAAAALGVGALLAVAVNARAKQGRLWRTDDGDRVDPRIMRHALREGDVPGDPAARAVLARAVHRQRPFAFASWSSAAVFAVLGAANLAGVVVRHPDPLTGLCFATVALALALVAGLTTRRLSRIDEALKEAAGRAGPAAGP